MSPLVEASWVHIQHVRRIGEFERLHGLLLEYEAALPPDLRHGLVGTVEQLHATYAEPGAALVATVDDDDAGCVAVTQIDTTTALMLRLYVRDRYRGRGLARALVTAALALLRQRGYRRVVLDTDKLQLSAAYELYRSLGFNECDPYGPVAYANATFMDFAL